MNYRDLSATDVISSFMKPVDEPIVVLGPVLQIFLRDTVGFGVIAFTEGVF